MKCYLSPEAKTLIRYFQRGALSLAFVLGTQAEVAFADGCSAQVTGAGIALKSEFKSLSNQTRKFAARLDKQSFDMMTLSEAALGKVPAAPVPPVMDETYFSVQGDLQWACDAEGAPTPSVEEYLAKIAKYSAELAAFQTALRDRHAAISAAQAGTDVAEDEISNKTSVAEAGDATPETAEDTTVVEETPADEASTEVVDAAAAQAEPLKDAHNPNLFQRVISLPNTTIRDLPDMALDAEDLPTFSVLYVFDESAVNGMDWLKVSSSLRAGTQGWVERDKTLDWSSMLVMKFAPRGKRSDVLFFANDTDLRDVVNNFTYAEEARVLYEGIAQERARLKSAPDAQPKWDDRLVAIEPATAVTFENQPYLLPILDWQEELFDGIIETTLLKVAAVPADATDVQVDDRNNRGTDLEEAALNDGVFRVGVMFVVDTTISMQPYIERTYDTIRTFYDIFQEMETTSFVSFGLMGFRDEMEGREDLSYTTKLFQPLDVDAPPDQILSNMRRATEAKVPTMEFKEDVYAGILDTVEMVDWTPYDARLIVLITDASARTGEDPRARYIGNTAESVAEAARARNIAIVPIHLISPANQKNGDAVVAEEQYRVLARTGDVNNDKYFTFDGANVKGFSRELGVMARSIAGATLAANSANLVVPQDEGVNVELEEVPVATVGTAVTQEVFRAQLESLAVASNGRAPNFLAGWTSDKDLTNPNVSTLDVSVFLTRNQLSTLDKQLASILDAFRSGGDDPTAFFENLQNLAAQTATDPDVVRNDDRAAMRAILPTFLQNLPYKSEVLQLDREFWNSLSNANRSEFIEQLVAKRKVYETLFESTELWQGFGANDPLLQVTPVRLTNLP